MSNTHTLPQKTIFVAVFSKLYSPLAYSHTDPIAPGVRVRVPLGKREVIGIVIACDQNTTEKALTKHDGSRVSLKPIIAVLDATPLLTQAMLELARFATQYYHAPPGEVLKHCLPKHLRVGKAAELKNAPTVNEQDLSKTASNTHTLTDAQNNAITAILNQTSHTVFLLEGVTGSGKTEVYLQIMEKLLKNAKQILYLIPEIGLTPQTLSRLSQRLSAPIVGFHSRLTDKQRLENWLLTKEGVAKVIVGTRSALFTPMPALGAIILDEVHDNAFNQQTGFRYNTRDLAIMRAKLEHVPIILGSATPSLESYYNCERQRFEHLTLPKRINDLPLPSTIVVDCRLDKPIAGLTQTLLKHIQDTLNNGQQIMLLLNRRGFSPVLYCSKCGNSAKCKHCHTHMTYHRNPDRLHCHHCDLKQPRWTRCPQCQADILLDLGVGTEKVEMSLEQHFPNHRISRMDRDTTQKKGTLDAILQTFESGEADILIGTQMIAKGHHFPNVALCALLDTDNALYSSDFRATEHLAQLITQMSGRAGRDKNTTGTVVLQTHYPEHPHLQTLLNEGYGALAKHLLSQRKDAMLPPFSHLALFRASGTQYEKGRALLDTIRTCITTYQSEQVTCLGPFPAPIEKRKGAFHWQLLLSSPSRPALQATLKASMPLITRLSIPRYCRWSLDVDPQDMCGF